MVLPAFSRRAGLQIRVRRRPAQRPQLQHAHVAGRQPQRLPNLPGRVAVQETQPQHRALALRQGVEDPLCALPRPPHLLRPLPPTEQHGVGIL